MALGQRKPYRAINKTRGSSQKEIGAGPRPGMTWDQVRWINGDLVPHEDEQKAIS
jgi:hypothetical protein